MIGRIIAVEERYLGSVLSDALSGGETSLAVDDPSDFDTEGTLALDPFGVEDGPEYLAWTDVDEDTGELTLDDPVVGTYMVGVDVMLYPLSVERWATLISGDNAADEEGILARVPHALYDRIPVGLRDLDAGEGETVAAEFISDELVIKDITGQAPIIDGTFIDTDTLPTGSELTDGDPPSSSPTPTVIGGPTFLSARWTAVTNNDPVTYEVHISASTGFTPSGATLYAETAATALIIKNLAGGSALSYGTTYYVKIIAKDADGSASASAQGSAAMVQITGGSGDIAANTITALNVAANTLTATEIAADAITASEIAANAVTAAKLAASLVLSTTIIAGTQGAARIELGTSDGGVGLSAYASDGETVKFSVDADTGNVYAAGRVDFGSGSRLDTDIMEFEELPFSGYQTPAIVQEVNETGMPASTASITWSQPTTAGNLNLLIISVFDPDGTYPTPSTPGGWTLVTNTTAGGGIGQFIYRANNGASRSGTQSVTLNDSVAWSGKLVELAGVEVTAPDKTAIDKSSAGSTSPNSGSTATTAQTNDILIGIIAYKLTNTPHPTISGETSGFTATSTYSTGSYDGTDGISQRVYWKNVTATGAYSFSATLSTSRPWAACILALKAKAAQVDAPAAGKVRIYALNDDARTTGDDASFLVMQTEKGIEKSLEFPGLSKFHASTAPSYFYTYSDFTDVGTSQQTQEIVTSGLIFTGTGTGIDIQSKSVASHPGVANIDTGSTSSGQVQLRQNHYVLDIGAGRIRFGSLVRIPTASDGSNTFFAGVGLKDFDDNWNNLTTGGDSIVVRYSHGTNSGKWQAACSTGGSSTTADTGVTMNAGSWYWIEIDVAADGSEAKIFINGSLTNTLSTNFPSGMIGAHACGINKTVGSTARSIDVDFYYCYAEIGTRA